MSETELSEVVRSTARESVITTLTTLGIQVDDPIQMQQDFMFIRNFRMSSQQATRYAAMTIIGILISGVIGLIVMGVRTYLKN